MKGTNNNIMKRNLAIAIIALLASSGAQARLSQQDYIMQWKETAIVQMEQFGIPASITLAQGILESASGNSELATKGNNHFGIKCHGWTGDKMYMDDDAKGECFRVYKNGEESYEDHSEFLKKYSRYEFLFELDKFDYKGWAKGLKQAGYATSPTYATSLIKLIEDLGLNEYDGEQFDFNPAPQIASTTSAQKSNKHSVQNHKDTKTKFVVAKNGDTFYKIADEFGLTLGQLRRYNDFSDKKDVLEEGDIIYVQPKRWFNLFNVKRTVTASETMTINEFAQKHGVRSGMILRLNDFEGGDDTISKGAKVTLQ